MAEGWWRAEWRQRVGVSGLGEGGKGEVIQKILVSKTAICGVLICICRGPGPGPRHLGLLSYVCSSHFFPQFLSQWAACAMDLASTVESLREAVVWWLHCLPLGAEPQVAESKGTPWTRLANCLPALPPGLGPRGNTALPWLDSLWPGKPADSHLSWVMGLGTGLVPQHRCGLPASAATAGKVATWLGPRQHGMCMWKSLLWSW